MSLTKIEQHQKKDVWLYVPNSYFEKADQVNSFLEGQKYIRKLTKRQIGWTLLTSYETGRKLIIEGCECQGMQIRFIYAKKN